MKEVSIYRGFKRYGKEGTILIEALKTSFKKRGILYQFIKRILVDWFLEGLFIHETMKAYF